MFFKPEIKDMNDLDMNLEIEHKFQVTNKKYPNEYFSFLLSYAKGSGGKSDTCVTQKRLENSMVELT